LPVKRQQIYIPRRPHKKGKRKGFVRKKESEKPREIPIRQMTTSHLHAQEREAVPPRSEGARNKGRKKGCKRCTFLVVAGKDPKWTEVGGENARGSVKSEGGRDDGGRRESNKGGMEVGGG